MKKSTVLLGLTLLFFSWLIQDLWSNSNGAPATYAGGPNEFNCGACHKGNALNSGTGKVSISTNIPEAGYKPGQQYEIAVSIEDGNYDRFGFEALAYSMEKRGGIGSVTLIEGQNTLLKSVTLSSRKEYVTHSGKGTTGEGAKTWKYRWKAPEETAGEIRFFASLVSADRDSTEKGDFVYTTDVGYPEYKEADGGNDPDSDPDPEPEPKFSIKFGKIDLSVNAQKQVELNWRTQEATWSGILRFKIERSLDSAIFEGIGTVEINSTAELENSLVYLDESPPTGKIYYRLRASNEAGEFALSKILALELAQIPEDQLATVLKLQVYPNPAIERIRAQIQSDADANVLVRVLDGQLRAVWAEERQISQGDNILTIDTDRFNGGMYFLSIMQLDASGEQMRRIAKRIWVMK